MISAIRRFGVMAVLGVGVVYGGSACAAFRVIDSTIGMGSVVASRLGDDGVFSLRAVDSLLTKWRIDPTQPTGTRVEWEVALPTAYTTIAALSNDSVAFVGRREDDELAIGLVDADGRILGLASIQGLALANPKLTVDEMDTLLLYDEITSLVLRLSEESLLRQLAVGDGNTLRGQSLSGLGSLGEAFVIRHGAPFSVAAVGPAPAILISLATQGAIAGAVDLEALPFASVWRPESRPAGGDLLPLGLAARLRGGFIEVFVLDLSRSVVTVVLFDPILGDFEEVGTFDSGYSVLTRDEFRAVCSVCTGGSVFEIALAGDADRFMIWSRNDRRLTILSLQDGVVFSVTRLLLDFSPESAALSEDGRQALLLDAGGALHVVPIGEDVARDDTISEYQAFLARSGFAESILVDGIPGQATAVAVQAFQRSMQLPVDGIIGPRTLEALDAAIARGSPEENDRFGLGSGAFTWIFHSEENAADAGRLELALEVAGVEHAPAEPDNFQGVRAPKPVGLIRIIYSVSDVSDYAGALKSLVERMFPDREVISEGPLPNVVRTPVQIHFY